MMHETVNTSMMVRLVTAARLTTWMKSGAPGTEERLEMTGWRETLRSGQTNKNKSKVLKVKSKKLESIVGL